MTFYLTDEMADVIFLKYVRSYQLAKDAKYIIAMIIISIFMKRIKNVLF